MKDLRSSLVLVHLEQTIFSKRQIKDVLTLNIFLVKLGEHCKIFEISRQTIGLGYTVYVRQINIYTLIKSRTEF